MGYLSLQITRKALREAVNDANLRMAGLAAVDIRARFDAILQGVVLLKEQLAGEGVTVAQQAQAMFQRRAGAPLTYRAIHLFDPSGELALRTSGPLEDILAAEEGI